MRLTNGLLARREAVVPRGVGLLTSVVASRGKGAYIYDAEGRAFLDFATGIGVMAIGHSHPGVVAAVREQAEALLHTCIHVATYEPYIALCERLCGLFPHGEATKAMLVNSGAEAVENAIKIARQATGRPGVICFTEGFHGRTLLALTLTSKVAYKTACGPFAPAVHRLQYPNHHRYGDGLSEERFVARELQRLEQLFEHTVPSKEVAALVIEPVQGEGGFVPLPTGYLQGLRAICDREGILLIVDEVQTGFCRTGRWAAYQHSGITPDLTTWAKAMGGGLPISAVVGKAEIMDAAAPGTLGGTYGGNPVACASALATIDVMEELDLPRRAAEIGQRVRALFLELQAELSAIVDVRGLGAMMAIELAHDSDGQRPAKDLVTRILRCCVERGLLIIPAGPAGNVIRVLVPLTITDDELDRGLSILAAEVRKACA